MAAGQSHSVRDFDQPARGSESRHFHHVPDLKGNKSLRGSIAIPEMKPAKNFSCESPEREETGQIYTRCWLSTMCEAPRWGTQRSPGTAGSPRVESDSRLTSSFSSRSPSECSHRVPGTVG